jgi:hypothetical protein
MSTTNTNPCRLLKILQELRDEIYADYLTEDEGYHHYPETNTQRCFDGKPIDLALMYCSKQIAQEMKGMPLELNAITFRTFLPKSETEDVEDTCSQWSTAGRFDYLLQKLLRSRTRAFAATAPTHGMIHLYSSLP